MSAIWTVVFPGVKSADDRRLLRLALFALAEPVSDGDPLRFNPAARIERACWCQPQRARAALETLRRAGWVDEAGEVTERLRGPA